MARSAADSSSPDSPNNTYHKPAEEWEVLGDLAERLHHDQEAVEAYQHCLRVRFSPKAMRGVMAWYEKQGRYGDVLQAMIRLIAWQYRWYSEVGPLQRLKRLECVTNELTKAYSFHQTFCAQSVNL